MRRSRSGSTELADYQNFLVNIVEGIGTLAINRPHKRNAMTVDMWRELAGICRDLGSERSLRAVVVTGTGPSFCAGADISALSADEASMREVVGRAERAVRELPVPTIAKISGHCMGGGTQIAIACDLRVADDTAGFAVPPAKLGVIYPVSSVRALTELVGLAWAKRLIFTAETVDARTALRIGLVEEVVAPDELDGAVEKLLRTMQPLSPMTQLAVKDIANRIADGGDAEAAYRNWLSHWQSSPDGVEGPRAFLERRAPRFDWRHPGAGD